MKNNMIIYVSKDGNVKVDVSIENEDIWMSQDVMANLYGTTKQNVSYHINNIFKEGLYNYNYRINEADSLVENIIDKTGCYLDYKKELVANLNSIQKYKLYLAGLLITNSKVIILEKIINDDKINDYLEELKNEQKITIIYIGNYKRTVDKSYVINNGIVSEVDL